MRKIAIIKGHDRDRGYENWEMVIERVTEFEEVDEETFDILYKAQSLYGYTLIEQRTDLSEFIPNTIKGYKEHVLKLQKAADKQKAEAEKLKQERAAKRVKANRTKAEKQLRVLAEQLGVRLPIIS
jgi:hypothetical protein